MVFARNLGPAELLDYDLDRLCGIVLEEGSPTAHVAIMARALDIPIVGRVAGCLGRVEAGDPIIVDGDNAQVFVRPTENVRTLFENTVRDRAERLALYAALRDLEPVSRDGVRVSLNQNAGLLVEMNDFADHGVDGVGLYRTEIPFMVRQDFPDVGEQSEIYMRVLAAADGAPVVFRTLDIGGDKVLPYLRDPKDDNPAMGWRAIRIGLDRPAILRHQLRAMILASAGQALNLMFPMVSDLAEFESARRLVDMELERAERRATCCRKACPSASCSKCRRWSGSFRRWSNGPISFRSAATTCSSSRSPATGAIRACRADTIRSPRPFWRWSGRSSKTAAPPVAARVCR